MKKIIVKIFFVILLFAIGLILLNYCIFGLPFLIKVPCTDEELQWFDPYQVGDTIIFNHGESIDTLIVTEKKVSNPQNMDPWDTENTGWETHKYFVGGGVFLLKTTRWSTNHIEVFFYLEARNYWGRNRISLGNTTTDPSHYLDGERPETEVDTFSTQITVNRIDTLPERKGFTKIRKFVWSRDSGLVFYETWKGNKFFLDTIIRTTSQVSQLEK